MGNTLSGSEGKPPLDAKPLSKSTADKLWTRSTYKSDTMPNIKEDYPIDLKIDQNPFKKGGFGSVHIGKMCGQETRLVAIKKQPYYLESDPESKKAFFLKNELIALKIVSKNGGSAHNCITCESFFKAGGFIFMVSPLCVTSFVIFKNLPFSNERSRLVLDLIFEIIQALNFIHGLGIVHRDIKAENILIKEKDGRCFAVVTDFGSCQLTNISYDRNDGTLQYLPPEGFKVGAKDCEKFGIEEDSILRYNNSQMDYWALGVLMYYMMTGGQFPFIDKDGRPTRIPREWIMWCYGPGNKMGPKEPLFNHDETGKKIKSTLPMVHTPRIDLTIPENHIMMKMLYGFLSPQPFYRWGSRQANNIKQELPNIDEDIINTAHTSFLEEIKLLPEYLQP